MVPTSDELRMQLAVAELEERLVALKDGGTEVDERLVALKEDLRYVRWVQRGGPAIEADLIAEHARLTEERERLLAEHPDLAEHLAVPLDPHTNRHVADLYARWKAEQS